METMETQTDAAGVKLGMWLFLFSEIMLFGGLFVLYAAYLSKFTPDFVAGGKQLDLTMGTVNTIILLISSFTVAAAIEAMRRETKKKALVLLGLTLFFGALFLFNKYLEWGHKIDVGIYPNSPSLASGPPGANIFFALYYIVTGLHGLHVVIGMIVIGVGAARVWISGISPRTYALVENSGLYWHLVDMIWIFVFPLFYLVI